MQDNSHVRLLVRYPDIVKANRRGINILPKNTGGGRMAPMSEQRQGRYVSVRLRWGGTGVDRVGVGFPDFV